jgi:hypothetical protein
MQETCQDYTKLAQTATTANNMYGGSLQPYVAPHICPGCGRCKDCGRPYETTPYNPWPGYPQPYVGDIPGWMQYGPTCGTPVGTGTLGSAYGGSTQVWN